MHYLLDTDITSYLIKRNSQHHQGVLRKLLTFSPERIAISAITVSELFSGVQQITHHDAVYKSRLETALTQFVTTINVLDFTLASAMIYGNTRAQLKQEGADIGSMDCLIAAHAVAEKRVLVTNNTKHFSRIKNLVLENWT